jgi:hypothetical protein
MTPKQRRSVFVDFSDPTLFGLDDARYEDLSRLMAFMYKRRGIERITSQQENFLIVSAPKGSGKTAIFRASDESIRSEKRGNSLLRYNTEVWPEIESEDFPVWVRGWKCNILKQISSSLAKKIRVAIDADSIAILEDAEQDGTIETGIFRWIATRFKFAGTGIEIKDSVKPELSGIIERWLLKHKEPIWVWIDEVDEEFVGTDRDIRCVASLLVAGRELAGPIENLYIRVAIKPNVLAILESNSNSLSKLRSHIMKLEWSNEDIRGILAKRVECHLKLHGMEELPGLVDQHEDWLMRWIFNPEGFDLGRGNRPAYQVVSTLGARRPRWVIELCKQAASNRSAHNQGPLEFEEFEHALQEYGRNRIVDFSSEYRCLCPDIEAILMKFNGSKPKYGRLHELLDFINKNVLPGLDTTIARTKGPVDALAIARLLYRIDFIQARIADEHGEMLHIFFQDRPDLLQAKFGDQNDRFEWVVHPGLRKALFLTTPRTVRSELKQSNRVSRSDKSGLDVHKSK